MSIAERPGSQPSFEKGLVQDNLNRSAGCTNYWPIACAIGVIVCLGAAFLTMAAHQVLPQGINAISDLGILGQALGYAGLGIGAIVILIGSVKSYLHKRQEPGALDPSLAAVIEQIRLAKSQNINTALFVGRTNKQPLPKEEGWAWFSLHCNKKKGDSSRHLHIDFNDRQIMQNIHHLFDKVVVDPSFIMFFRGSPWDALQPLLVKCVSSKLIVESDKGREEIGGALVIDGRNACLKTPNKDQLTNSQIENQRFEAWKKDVGLLKFDEEYESFLQTLETENKKPQIGDSKSLFKRHILEREGLALKKVDYRPQLLKNIREYLLTLFHNVELKKGPYPYRGDETPREYWVVSHPK